MYVCMYVCTYFNTYISATKHAGQDQDLGPRLKSRRKYNKNISIQESKSWDNLIQEMRSRSKILTKQNLLILKIVKVSKS